MVPCKLTVLWPSYPSNPSIRFYSAFYWLKFITIVPPTDHQSVILCIPDLTRVFMFSHKEHYRKGLSVVYFCRGSVTQSPEVTGTKQHSSHHDIPDPQDDFVRDRICSSRKWWCIWLQQLHRTEKYHEVCRRNDAYSWGGQRSSFR